MNGFASLLPSRRSRVAALFVVASLAAGAVFASGSDGNSPDGAPARVTHPTGATERAVTPTTSTPRGPLTVVIDHALRPKRETVAGFAPGDAPRPVGRVEVAPGEADDYVLDEVHLLAPDASALEDFVARWHGVIIDRANPAPDRSITALVRVDVSLADPGGLASDLTEIEPDHTGTMRVGSERLQQLLALIAAEAATRGTVVAPVGLVQSDSIHDGTAEESTTWDPEMKYTPSSNAFSWGFLRDGNGIDTGVAPAWQLLEHSGQLTAGVSLEVVDGGFSHNPDFPHGSHIGLHYAEWGDENAGDCGDHSCPYHGSDTVTTAIGKVDNEYGTAGPGGPVVDELHLVQMSNEQYTTLRHALKVVEDHSPDLVNMSYGGERRLFRDTTESLHDWYYKRMRDHGALLFGSAGNKGIDVDARTCGSSDCDESMTILPCESRYVVCVGGVNTNGTWNDGSNYGTVDNNRSVEIYGPWCTYGKFDHETWVDRTWTSVCGTSESSPFLAGVAALVLTANPDLSPSELWAAIRDTAHHSNVLADRTRVGSNLIVDAYEAVRTQLGVQITPPTVEIVEPTPGEEVGIDEWIDLRANGSDLFDAPLVVAWTSDVDGDLGTTNSGSLTSTALSPGTHVITATITDYMAQSASATVTVRVVDTPPEAIIVSPADGAAFNEFDAISFAAWTKDPDTFSPVADKNVHWNVQRNGVDVWSGTGHTNDLAAGAFEPGAYTVELRANDGPGEATATSTFTVEAIPEGESVPVVHIVTPVATLDVDAYNGHPVDINFAGTATNDGVALGGSRFEWTARNTAGETVVLCRGHLVPGHGNGGIVLPKDCGEFVGALGLDDDGENITVWIVTLRVWNAHGSASAANRTVRVRFITG
jgi:hypothetical protein